MLKILTVLLRNNFRCGRMLNSRTFDLTGRFAVPSCWLR